MIHGVLNVYKEAGFTSHDVVAKLRGIVKQKKIGHTGTLDPDATGVLPVCLGKATRLCDMLTDETKTYETVLLLGQSTDTQDIGGTVLKRAEPETEPEKIRSCIQKFIGEYQQIPPMYSALKVNGKKLYELAREGIEVERKPRRVQFHEIEILKIEPPNVWMRVTCSKGTYIRTLCHDIGQKLGCGACMASLKRTRSGQFSIEDAITLSEAERRMKEGTLEEMLVSVESVFSGLPVITVKPGFEVMAQNGNSFYPNQIRRDDNGKIRQTTGETEKREEARLYDESGRFYGIYLFDEQNKRWKPEKMFL